jgi:NAD(P)-dependent dehydrogenase (short-subunit alcohol dehydrogenase family)
LGNLGPVWIAALLTAGARVMGLDVREAPLPDPLKTLTDSHRDQLLIQKCDIRSVSDLRAALRACMDRLGNPEILVNNAGIDSPPMEVPKTWRVQDWPLDDFRAVVDLNLSHTFSVCQVFGSEMVRSGRGSIINIGSLYASLSPDPALYDHIRADPPFIKPAAYGASKAALVNLTRYLAVHWAPAGVRVNALSPGGVLGKQDAERMAESADLVGPLVFLASDASRYVTGVELLVDGGFTAI